jgi:broad specificity phosphatase PhoE
MKLTLIRHAQSVSKAGGITEPHLTLSLTAHGHAQARALGATIEGPPSTVCAGSQGSRLLRILP